MNANQLSEPSDTAIINIAKFSSYRALIKLNAIVMNFKNSLLHKDSDTFEDAKTYWIKQIQRECFKDEIEYLEGGSATNPPTYVCDLNVFIDKNGILRCRGRLAKANFYAYNVLNPILLSKRHYLTRLLVWDQHYKVKHLGVGTTLT